MIRKINSNDLKQLYEIEKENFIISEQYKDVDRLLLNKNYLIVGNFEGDNLISYIIGIKMSKQYELLKIATRKKFQNKGFASKLFKYIAKDFEEIFLEVNENNSNALTFYKKLGFERIGLRKSYYANNENAINLAYKNHQEDKE